jgi:hypothetical protein
MPMPLDEFRQRPGGTRPPAIATLAGFKRTTAVVTALATVLPGNLDRECFHRNRPNGDHDARG